MNLAQYLATPVAPLSSKEEKKRTNTRVKPDQNDALHKKSVERYQRAFASLGGKANTTEIARQLGCARTTASERIIAFERLGLVVRAGTITVRGAKAIIWKWSQA